jgi:hypothetical protein
MHLVHLENKLFILSETLGVSVYDYDFARYFSCTHPHQIDGEQLCVLRKGSLPDYAAEYARLLTIGLRLVNAPEAQARASLLEHWYPLIQALTPRTMIFECLPAAEVIEAHFEWPIFLKGSRQTSKHNPDLAVIRSRQHYQQAVPRYQSDPILHWQKPVVREFIPLAPVPGAIAGKIQPSLEFRSFWWQGNCVGVGPYWYQAPPYQAPDLADGLALAGRAAQALQVPFLVVDFAKTARGDWIVIECNDAQESGYAGIAPRLLWQRVLALL